MSNLRGGIVVTSPLPATAPKATTSHRTNLARQPPHQPPQHQQQQPCSPATSPALPPLAAASSFPTLSSPMSPRCPSFSLSTSFQLRFSRKSPTTSKPTLTTLRSPPSTSFPPAAPTVNKTVHCLPPSQPPRLL